MFFFLYFTIFPQKKHIFFGNTVGVGRGLGDFVEDVKSFVHLCKNHLFGIQPGSAALFPVTVDHFLRKSDLLHLGQHLFADRRGLHDGETAAVVVFLPVVDVGKGTVKMPQLGGIFIFKRNGTPVLVFVDALSPGPVAVGVTGGQGLAF